MEMDAPVNLKKKIPFVSIVFGWRQKLNDALKAGQINPKLSACCMATTRGNREIYMVFCLFCFVLEKQPFESLILSSLRQYLYDYNDPLADKENQLIAYLVTLFFQFRSVGIR